MSWVIDSITDRRLDDLRTRFEMRDISRDQFCYQEGLIWKDYMNILARERKLERKSGNGDGLLLYAATWGGPPNGRGHIFVPESFDLG
jgi:hypothetical protein